MSWKRFADQVVECLPSGSFRVSVTGDEVSRGKPHPDPYLLAAERLGVDARECVAIEDSPTGVRSALAAGCRVLGVPHVIEIPSDLDQGSGQLVIAQSLVGKTLSDLVW
jgi:beta-phosphoglucomutase-like phosphatase (HAD superfamily)